MTIPSDFVTLGHKHHIGYVLPLVIREYPDFPASRLDCPAFQLGFLRRGSCVLHVGTKRLLIHAPSIWLLDETEDAIVESLSDGSLSTAYFPPSLINGAFTFEELRRDPLPFTGTARNDAYLLMAFFRPDLHARVRSLRVGTAERLASAFENIERGVHLQDDPFWPCRSRSWLIEILFLLSLEEETPKVVGVTLSPDAGLLDRALVLVHERYPTRFTVDDLAKWCGTNRTTLNRRFLEKTGQTVQVYVRNVRMTIAAGLLRDTTIPIEDVALRVGYLDTTGFSRSFRGVIGQSPGEYRRLNNWMLAD